MATRLTNQPKIVIYGAGTIGQLLTQFAVKKGWPVVAAFNRPGKKIGRDLGQLAGLDRDLGVCIQDAETADYSKLKADIALIAITDRMASNMPAYERMLEAGVNVLCHGAESYTPWFTNRDLTSTIDVLAKKNGVSFSGSGIWDSTRFWSGMVAAGPCVEINSIVHRSLTDTPRQGTHLMLALGTGMSVADYNEKMVKSLGAVGGVYTQVPVAILQKIGYTVSSIKERREPVLFDEPYYCATLDKTLMPGTVIGTRVVIDVETDEGSTAKCEVELRPLKEGEEEDMHWSVYGQPTFHLRLRREQSRIASASSLFNRIPDVLAASPGVVDLMSFGPVIPSVFA